MGVAIAQQAPPRRGERAIVVTGTRITTPGFESSSQITSVGAEEIQLPAAVRGREDHPRTLPMTAPGRRPERQQRHRPARRRSTFAAWPERNLRHDERPAHRAVRLQRPGRYAGRSRRPAGARSTSSPAAHRPSTVRTPSSGVVNFILNDDFEGAQLDANYSITDHGDGETENYQATMGAGFDDGRGNVVLQRRLRSTRKPSIRPVRRAPLRRARPSRPHPAGVDTARSARARSSRRRQLVPFYQGFDFNPQNLYQTPQTRWNATALAKYDINRCRGLFALHLSNSSSAPQLASSGTFGLPVRDSAQQPVPDPTGGHLSADQQPDRSCTNDYGVIAPRARLRTTWCPLARRAVGPRA